MTFRIVAPPFQRMGLGSKLTKRLIRQAKSMGFSGIAAVTSMRPQDHPLRPQNYFDTDTLWNKYGFEKTAIELSSNWPTRQADGCIKEEENKLACWFNNRL